jgi:hypothetical protein
MVIIKLCLPLLLIACCQGALASTRVVQKETKVLMMEDIARGSNEVFNCALGLDSDKEITECVSSILDDNIQKETDTAPFLAGAYFSGFARLTAGKSTAGVKDKWLATYFRRFSELQKHIGFTDEEMATSQQSAFAKRENAAERELTIPMALS